MIVIMSGDICTSTSTYASYFPIRLSFTLSLGIYLILRIKTWMRDYVYSYQSCFDLFAVKMYRGVEDIMMYFRSCSTGLKSLMPTLPVAASPFPLLHLLDARSIAVRNEFPASIVFSGVLFDYINSLQGLPETLYFHLTHTNI